MAKEVAHVATTALHNGDYGTKNGNGNFKIDDFEITTTIGKFK